MWGRVEGILHTSDLHRCCQRAIKIKEASNQIRRYFSDDACFGTSGVNGSDWRRGTPLLDPLGGGGLRKTHQAGKREFVLESGHRARSSLERSWSPGWRTLLKNEERGVRCHECESSGRITGKKAKAQMHRLPGTKEEKGRTRKRR